MSILKLMVPAIAAITLTAGMAQAQTADTQSILERYAADYELLGPWD